MKYYLLICGTAFLFTFIVLAIALPFNDFKVGNLGAGASFLAIASLIWIGNVLIGVLAKRFLKENH